MRSSVDRRASSFASLARSPPTKSSARKAAAGGQCKHAVRRRFAKAAERQGGAAAPNVRGEKTIFKARNSISITECVFSGRTSDVNEDGGALSISGIRLNGRMIEYNREIKSLRSMFSASPGKE